MRPGALCVSHLAPTTPTFNFELDKSRPAAEEDTYESGKAKTEMTRNIWDRCSRIAVCCLKGEGGKWDFKAPVAS